MKFRLDDHDGTFARVLTFEIGPHQTVDDLRQERFHCAEVCAGQLLEVGEEGVLERPILEQHRECLRGSNFTVVGEPTQADKPTQQRSTLPSIRHGRLSQWLRHHCNRCRITLPIHCFDGGPP